MHTVESLKAFTERVKAAFLAKQIRAPVHLAGGNESQLLEVFKNVRERDWAFSTWRSSYHALLKGIPEDSLFDMILNGRSMYVMSREYRFLASSIVGGMLPIACGVAMAIKRRAGSECCWCFVGDMCSRTGIYHETVQYAKWHDLPMRFVVEDNGYSTDTPTSSVWGENTKFVCTQYYHYEREYPHVGVGTHVSF